MPFLLYQGDITHVKVDAIVNAANRELKQGGGVCGAIFKAAGEQAMQQACDELAPVEVGEAVITPAFKLPSKYVIHTVGPVWSGGKMNEEALLASCYTSSLMLAHTRGLRSIAFPLISSGTFGYPKDQAYKTAVSTILAFLEKQEMTVYLVLFEEVFFKDEELRKKKLAEYVRRNLSTLEPGLTLMDNILECRSSQEPDQIMYSMIQRKSSRDKPLKGIVTDLEESFSQCLMRLIREKGLDEVVVYKGANIDRKHFSKIRSNDSYQPTKRTVIAFALSLKLNAKETRNLLQRAGFSLSHSYVFDIIIEYFIENKQYDIHAINEALFSYEQPLLGA